MAEVGGKPAEGSLVVVDFSKPSSEKRMTVVDLKTGRAKMNSHVAHGVNSGLLYATQFSDRPGSNQSSLGLFKVGEEYVGKHGRSLRLDGLDPGFNINARRRAIVVHAADYVSREAMVANRHEYGRLGRSAGCLSLSDDDMEKLLGRKLKRPAYIFAYAPTMVAGHEYPEPGASQKPKIMLASSKTPSSPSRANPATRTATLVSSSADKPAIARTAVATTPSGASDNEGMTLVASIERPAVARPSSLADEVPAASTTTPTREVETGPAADEPKETESTAKRLVSSASKSLVSTVSRVNFLPNWP